MYGRLPWLGFGAWPSLGMRESDVKTRDRSADRRDGTGGERGRGRSEARWAVRGPADFVLRGLECCVLTPQHPGWDMVHKTHAASQKMCFNVQHV